MMKLMVPRSRPPTRIIHAPWMWLMEMAGRPPGSEGFRLFFVYQSFQNWPFRPIRLVKPWYSFWDNRG